MSDSGFLQAIVSEPNEDAHRLVYADWLEEHGQAERADIIRVQCALARLRYDDDAVSSLQAQEYRLLARHHAEWKAGLITSAALFRRGFVEVLPCFKVSTFLFSESMFASHPITELDLGCQDEWCWGKDAAACHWLSRIETLRLGKRPFSCPPLSDFLAVLSSPHLTNLTTLDAGGGHQYDDAGLREMLGTSRRKEGRKNGLVPSLAKLKRLSLHGMALTDGALRALARSPLAETLTHLDLSSSSNVDPYITESGISALVDSPLWERLEELNLNNIEFQSVKPLRILFAALHRSRITRLGFRRSRRVHSLRDGVVEAMMAGPSWGRLETLDLGSWGLTSEGLRLLLQGPWLSGIRWLAFDFGLGDQGLKALASCPLASGITYLSLENGGSDLTDKGLGYLAESPYLNRLVSLNLVGTAVQDAGMAALMRSPNASRLRILDLPGHLGDMSFQAIASSSHASRLNAILFGSETPKGRPSTLSDAGILALTLSQNLPNLVGLDLKYNSREITPFGWTALIKCKGLAWVGAPEGLGPVGRAFRARFPLSHYEVTRDKRLRLFPWSQYSSS